jgi:hypothetical protein
MNPLIQIVYTSTADAGLSKVDLMELLKGSVQRNTLAGITGLLLYKDGIFIQALEGDQNTVAALFKKICSDRRHHNVISLIQERITHRDFPDSAMSFRDLNAPELRKLPGYSEFLNTPLNGDLHQLDIPKCKLLLLLFKKNVR